MKRLVCWGGVLVFAVLLLNTTPDRVSGGYVDVCCWVG